MARRWTRCWSAQPVAEPLGRRAARATCAGPFARSPRRRVGSSFAACGTISAGSWRNTRISARTTPMSRPHRDARTPRTFVPRRRRPSAPSSSPVISAIGGRDPAPSRGAGLDVVEMYRAANNPIVDRRLSHSRPRDGQRACRQGRGRGAAHADGDEEQAVCRYAHRPEDQCRHPRPAFFDRDAMTAPSLAVFALRYDCAVVPVRVDRLAGARLPHHRRAAPRPAR
jgi:hypothetical protein